MRRLHYTHTTLYHVVIFGVFQELPICKASQLSVRIEIDISRLGNTFLSRNLVIPLCYLISISIPSFWNTRSG